MARVLILVLALAACGRDSAGQATSSSGASYRAGLAALAGREEAAHAALAAHTGDHYDGDEPLVQALRNQVIPAWRDIATELDRLAPPPALAALHGRLVSHARDEIAVFEELAAAIEAGDGVRVLGCNQRRRQLAAARDELANELTAALR